jgi:uncharacterized protein YbdZ (MbtH family)
MSKIQQPQAASNSATPKATQIPNGWAKVPHSISRDPSLTMQARALWSILKSRQAQESRRRVRLVTLMQDTGTSKRSVQKWLTELKEAGLLEIKITGRASYYTALEKCETCKVVHVRGAAECMSTKQETLRKKKAGQPPIGLTLACFDSSPYESQSTTAPRRKQGENLQPAAADFHSLEIELFLNTAGQHFPQIPEVTRKVSEALGTLFGMGWQSPGLIAELQKSITNPQAGAGLFVTELERLAAIPRQESYTATHTPTRAEHQLEELEEVWGTVEPQEQADQYEENSQEWIATIRADLNQRKREKIS